MRNLIFSLGGTKFIATVGCGFTTSFLCYTGHIDAQTYSLVTIATVGAFIAGNVIQKAKELKANKDESI